MSEAPVRHLTTREQQPPPDAPETAVGSLVVSAVGERWPSLTVSDLVAVHGWAEAQPNEVGADRLIAHLFAEAGNNDPRICLAIQMSAPLSSCTAADVAVSQPAPDRESGTVLRFPIGRPDRRWTRVPHELIKADLSDLAVQMWLVLGSVPATDTGHRSVAPGWIARRAGWDSSSAAAERRVQRAAAELQAAGWLLVSREAIGGGRTRPAYHRLRQPRRSGYEIVDQAVLGLAPALLRSYLRWLVVMGHRGETHFSVSNLAQRWGMSRRQVGRQLQDLIDAGLLDRDSKGRISRPRPIDDTADDGVDGDIPDLAVSDDEERQGFQGVLPLALDGAISGGEAGAASLPDPPLEEQSDNGVADPPDKNVAGGQGATFLSGGVRHSCRPKEVHTRKAHTSLGTSVPNVEIPTASEPVAEPSPNLGDDHRSPSGSPAAQPPQRRQSRRTQPPQVGPPNTRDGDFADQEANRVLHRFLWLRRTPSNVPHMLKSVIARHIRKGLTADEIIDAIAERLTPEDLAEDQHVPALRVVLRGVWADRKADPAPSATTRTNTTEESHPRSWTPVSHGDHRRSAAAERLRTQYLQAAQCPPDEDDPEAVHDFLTGILLTRAAQHDLAVPSAAAALRHRIASKHMEDFEAATALAVMLVSALTSSGAAPTAQAGHTNNSSSGQP